MPIRPLLFASMLFALGAAPSTRPAAFRCVLDGNARMIVVPLADDVFAAYDANRCTLAKLWRGTVVLTGPVYDTRHGPQPRSEGVQLLDRAIELAPTPAEPATRPTDYANVNGYRGYSVRDGVATLHFDFDGVTVDETLTLVSEEAGSVVVRRTLAVGGAVSKSRPYRVFLPTPAALRRLRMGTADDLRELPVDPKPTNAPADGRAWASTSSVPFDRAATLVTEMTFAAGEAK